MTAANASPNVDVAFGYQVARPTGGTPSRCVSTPRWRRTSASSHHAPA